MTIIWPESWEKLQKETVRQSPEPKGHYSSCLHHGILHDVTGCSLSAPRYDYSVYSPVVKETYNLTQRETNLVLGLVTLDGRRTKVYASCGIQLGPAHVVTNWWSAFGDWKSITWYAGRSWTLDFSFMLLAPTAMAFVAWAAECSGGTFPGGTLRNASTNGQVFNDV